ncbi:MAG: T9SS type A sorting domain-containing protein [Bacteroidota bacterium]
MRVLSAILVMTLLWSAASIAQITITKQDMANYYTIGTTHTTQFAIIQGTVNVGNKGGGNTWDFSGYTAEGTSSTTAVDPASTPYISDFPTANAASLGETESGGIVTSNYSYFHLNSSIDLLGSVSGTDFQTFAILTKTVYTPPDLLNPLPLNYNDSFTSYTQRTSTTEQPPLPPSVSTGSQATNAVVDAYGTLILPGGMSYQALRMRQTHHDTINGFTGASTSFIFITKEGASASISDSGATTAEEGVITINGGVGWTGTGVVSVDEGETQPVEFQLQQNYPNPFNPSTVLSYSIPEKSHVRLSAFDLLGREVAELVNEVKGAGTYRVTFDASGLPSGTYLYRITAGEFTSVRKMTFVK